MALTEIKPMRGECLYDRDGNLVGKWNGERGMFADCYVVRERTCHMDEDDYEIPSNIIGNLTTWFCSECGSPTFNDMTLTYCPYCGARVVDE